ncbi:hypothetical protein LMG1860_05293 [Achromobacter denitrificans]|nr:hypothetical protein LMG1860_05293 [Achromobacter denitrificans]
MTVAVCVSTVSTSANLMVPLAVCSVEFSPAAPSAISVAVPSCGPLVIVGASLVPVIVTVSVAVSVAPWASETV